MLAAVEAMSPPGTEIIVADNASRDGSREYLKARKGIRAVLLPTNVGHGVALDIVVPRVETEYLAVLDIDAFPVSDQWLAASIAALETGAQAAGAHLHRNFVHPSFLVMRTEVLHRYGLTFRPVGSLANLRTSAPLFLDVAEALCQRLIVKFGGGSALHFFEPTSVSGPGMSGAVFGGIVYHNLYSTQGVGRASAISRFTSAFAEHHPDLSA
jgi:glycosyltransferase involved in cell wall biosynthesis